MLRKFLACMIACGTLFLTACGKEDDIEVLSRDEVYFFYQEACPHCHTAAAYIKEKHPDMRIKALDIKMPGNHRLFEKAIGDYDITGVAGTPLICFGRHYVMGWGEDDIRLFDEYAKDYE